MLGAPFKDTDAATARPPPDLPDDTGVPGLFNLAQISLEMFTNLKCSQISNATTGNCNLALADNGDHLGVVNNPAEWRAWALGTDGRRECEVPCAFDPATGRLRFTASVRQPFGGCMLYEVVRSSSR